MTQHDNESTMDTCGPAETSACALPSRAVITGDFEITRTEEEWRRLLTPEQYHVMREAGTEPPFRNRYWNNKREGIYVLAGTKIPLFSSAHKYDSGTGWPSFWKPLVDDNIGTATDTSHGITRTEVHCRLDGSHLGHVFDDGPSPTGKRYCINSAALDFIPIEELDQHGLGEWRQEPTGP